MPDDLTISSNVVNNDVVKKTDYNALKTKVDGLDVTNYATKSSATLLVREKGEEI